ncbi:MAG: sigma 54-dependent Fis family transcriptional regulator [Deltaproteobacteria bacterium]|nr:sigma 54-dependent Fis family transcriptional regulator [Deltaproteobacteria bacterium]
MTEPETRALREGGAAHLQLPGIKLTVVEGPDRGREAVARRGAVRIGTAGDNDLVLTDTAVSRRHLEVRLRAGEVRAVDLGSKNGTTVDGVAIVEAILSAASLIRIGATAIRALPVEDPVVVPLSSRERFGQLLGRSVAMREAFAVLERAAPTEATVLIEGETGTGKELAAEAIHGHSPRAEGPFVTIDCGAIAPTLMESEIFGHVRGAFTGAQNDRRGIFEEADGGTLFLDEVGELPLDLQPKLLRVLEKREVRRVGASQPRKVDVRVVAATNRNLLGEIDRGGFREDLYFRLAVVTVKLPPLRARTDDVPLLVRHFVECLAPGSPPPSAELLAAMAARPWPGNVRELRNAVERALAMAGPERPGSSPGPGDQAPMAEAMEPLFQLPIKEAIERWAELFERAYLGDALRRSGGSVSGAARMAGVNRRFVQRMMKRHGMRDDSGEPDEE